jgi:hypothetical protein
MRTLLGVLATSLMLALGPPALAQNTVGFVAGNSCGAVVGGGGGDTNSCTQTISGGTIGASVNFTLAP